VNQIGVGIVAIVCLVIGIGFGVTFQQWRAARAASRARA
jgi:hypothetical protein